MVDMRFHATGCVSRAAVICLLLLAVTPVRAQDFPVKPIRVFVPFATGNPLDNMLRVVSEGLQRSLGQPFVVDNRPGAGGIVAAQALLASPAEGYSLLLATAAILTVNPHSYKNLARPETTTRLRDLGMQATGGTSAEFAQKIARERERWGRVVKLTGFSVQD